MIYTVTFNPALDYVLMFDKLQEGALNRSLDEYISFGGKGINVSVVLSELGVETTALGFLAGFTGEELEKELKIKGVKTDFVYLPSGNTRINVKIKTGEETEINACGPNIDEKSLDKLFDKLDTLTEDDYIVLSGSIPISFGQNIYYKILKLLANKNVQSVVDAQGDLLLDTLCFKPFLIKPNLIELETMMGKRLFKEEDIISAAKELRQKGAKNVLVSLGAKGAILIDEKGVVHRQQTPSGNLINSVGAGDSMIAGFLKGYLDTGDYKIALKYGVSAGSATAFSMSLASREEILNNFNKID